MWIRLVAVAVPVTVTLLDTVGCVARVEGKSMQPALNPDSAEANEKDYVFLNKWAVKSYQFGRGDVVSLMSPSNPDQKIIKRIIGLEGDIVRSRGYRESEVLIPKGHCWVEGDHHKQSMDSNFFGPVAMGMIVAKASHIVWPPKRWQRMKCNKPVSTRFS